MRVNDQQAYAAAKAKNDDPYGSGIYRFLEEWANLMEPRIDAGEKLADIAKDCSREADSEGITGFMYGAAVSVLSGFWVYGEELRRWHNGDVQIGNEGDKANESGGVLNPAVLVIA